MNDEPKIRLGWGALTICALVFCLLGAIFLLIGVVFGINLDKMTFTGDGDPVMLPVSFIIVGLVAAIAGIACFIIAIYKRNRKKALVADGSYVMAEVVAINRNRSIQVNGMNPYFIECHYTDSYGAIHVFKSDNIFFYPAELIGKQLKVYADMSNLKNYYVSVDGLNYTLK